MRICAGETYATVSSGIYFFRWASSGGHLFGSGSVRNIFTCLSSRFSNSFRGITPCPIILNRDFIILGDSFLPFSISTPPFTSLCYTLKTSLKRDKRPKDILHLKPGPGKPQKRHLTYSASHEVRASIFGKMPVFYFKLI